MQSASIHLNRFIAVACILAMSSAAFARPAASPASKLERIGDAAVAKCLKTSEAAVSAIAKAAAKGDDDKALAAAERARAKLEAIADKARSSIAKTYASLERKIAGTESEDHLMLSLNFAENQANNSIERQLRWCRGEITQALADAGLIDP